jgi:RNA-directed DNA polymerase
MKITSHKLFDNHFSPDNLKEVIDLHLAPSSARGVDGTNYDRFLEKMDDEIDLISSRALKGEYKFSPFRQKLIIKDRKSPPRQISIPTIRDKIALRALNNFLTECFPDARPQHSHQVISSSIKSISNATQTDKFIKLDIQTFYDDINHEVLIRNLKLKIRSTAPLKIVLSAIETPTGSTIAEADKNSLGVPQGLSISNILASIYLHSIDKKYRSIDDIDYHRYVDDIFCITSSSKAKLVASAISKDLKAKKKLKTHPIGSGKSTITKSSEELTYLGYTFSGATITVRESTEKRLFSSLMRILHSASLNNLEKSIWRLNLRISGCRLNGNNIGWMFYFSQINDKKLLSRIDAQIKKTVLKRFGKVEANKCKRLIKAYHEVKYSYKDSNYFSNFDNFDRDEMIALLNKVFPDRYTKLEEKSDAHIRQVFNRVVTREVREMERDTLGSFS